MRIHKKNLLLLVCSVMVFQKIYTDPSQPHFYVATYNSLKPRAERRGLVNFDINAFHGKTSKGKDARNNTTNILGIYGPQEMHMVGKNVDLTPFSAANQAILTNLWKDTQSDPLYATMAFSGKISYSLFEFKAGINITDNIFVACIIPLSTISVSDTAYVDTTPADISDAPWQAFYANFDSILKQAGLTFGPAHNGGIEDVALYTGWTKNKDDFQSLYFLDFTIALGISIGSAKAKDQNSLFDIARGYNRHKGFLSSFDLALSPLEGITVGLGLSNVYLFKRTQFTRLQSAPGQNGFVKLSGTQATCEPGSIYRFGGYVTYDKNVFGATVSYNYVCQTPGETFSTPIPALFPPDVVNADTMFARWSQHVIGLAATIDWAADDPNRFAFPHASIFYNCVIKGNQSFLNNTVGGNLGVALTLDF